MQREASSERSIENNRQLKTNESEPHCGKTQTGSEF
jgi:hypothetical protein